MTSLRSPLRALTRRRFLTAIGLGAGALAVGGCMSARLTSAGPGWRGTPSDHFDGQRFFNPRGPTGNTRENFRRWRDTRTPRPWPAAVANHAVPRLSPAPGEPLARVTFVNHCTYLIQLDGCTLLTDPLWSERASPVSFAGPRRVRPPGVAWDALPRVDAVLVSHNHYDHLDLPTLRALRARFAPRFITGLGNGAFLRAHGFKAVEELDWWQSASDPSGLGARVTFTPAQHWSARGLTERNTTLWGGFFVETRRERVYFAGDTGHTPDFADIRARLGAPDLALLPIGAYEPRWFMKPSHMDAADAVRAHGELGARRSLGMHFDAFAMADEGFGDAEKELAAARAAAGLADSAFVAPATGETILIHAPA